MDWIAIATLIVLTAFVMMVVCGGLYVRNKITPSAKQTMRTVGQVADTIEELARLNDGTRIMEDRNNAVVMDIGRLTENDLEHFLLSCAGYSQAIYSWPPRDLTLPTGPEWAEYPMPPPDDDDHTEFYAVARVNSGKIDQLFIVVRGTEKPEDVRADIKAGMVPLKGETLRSTGQLSGVWGEKTPSHMEEIKLHRGFHDRTFVLLERLDAWMADMRLSMQANAQVVVTGHSLGGAVATLTAFVLSRRVPAGLVKLATFGAPRVFMMERSKRAGVTADFEHMEETLQRFISQFSNLRMYRCRVYEDPVPGLPPRQLPGSMALQVPAQCVYLRATDDDTRPIAERNSPVEYYIEVRTRRKPKELFDEENTASVFLTAAAEAVGTLKNANRHIMTEYMKRLYAVTNNARMGGIEWLLQYRGPSTAKSEPEKIAHVDK